MDLPLVLFVIGSINFVITLTWCQTSTLMYSMCLHLTSVLLLMCLGNLIGYLSQGVKGYQYVTYMISSIFVFNSNS